MQKLPKQLTITELADFLQENKRTLYRMIKDGRFPVLPIKGSKPSRWCRLEVLEWRLQQ